MRSVGSQLRRNRPDAADWFALETRLLAAGAEKLVSPLYTAYRDPRRPRMWDRHLFVPTGVASHLNREVRLVDRWYRETGTEQWSLVAASRELVDDWGTALVARGAASETLVYMDKSSQPVEGSPGIEVIPASALDRLVAVRQALAVTAAERSLARAIAGLWHERVSFGFESVILCARERDEPVATMCLTVVGSLVWMEDLETRPDCRRHGHGRALLQAAEHEARRRGGEWIGLHAVANDWPINWYERLGYRHISTGQRLRRELDHGIRTDSRAGC